jgi:hypothetical protein
LNLRSWWGVNPASRTGRKHLPLIIDFWPLHSLVCTLRHFSDGGLHSSGSPFFERRNGSCGSEWVRGEANFQFFRLSVFKTPTRPNSPLRPPLTIPSHVFSKSCSRRFSLHHFITFRSLLILDLSQNRDAEKDVNVTHGISSKPGSDHYVEVSDLSNKLQNPLAGRDKATLEADAVFFCERHGLMEYGVWLLYRRSGRSN